MPLFNPKFSSDSLTGAKDANGENEEESPPDLEFPENTESTEKDEATSQFDGDITDIESANPFEDGENSKKDGEEVILDVKMKKGRKDKAQTEKPTETPDFFQVLC
jgi:hypothetical protein